MVFFFIKCFLKKFFTRLTFLHMKYKCMYKQKGINDTKYMNKKNMITKKTCFFKRLLQNLVTYKKKINKKKYKKKN